MVSILNTENSIQVVLMKLGHPKIYTSNEIYHNVKKDRNSKQISQKIDIPQDS